MDEFKPEDELKPDPSDRRTGRSRQSSERDNEPQINFDDVDLDADDRRPTRTRKARSEEPEVEEEYESDEDDTVDEERVERRPRKRKKAAHKPASRQYMMMGVGVLVLLLLIIGIGSALKAPSTSSSEPSASGEKSIDLSGNAADQANATQPAPDTTSAEQTAGNTSQDISLPPISSTPTQGQSPVVADGQQRVEVQGDLNNALTQNPEQMNNVAVNSTLRQSLQPSRQFAMAARRVRRRLANLPSVIPRVRNVNRPSLNLRNRRPRRKPRLRNRRNRSRQ
ncbi:DamX protein [Salmonella enterica subsp. enterica]|uniref:DamX protein n=1 Tax=Salmonella enterica I TaxID=59201 RepID=A0A3S5DDS2_SALET|nr:DamX protein [Salmonella enterica subsp. enterica]